MPPPVALRLSRNSQPPWLTHLGRPQGFPLQPLLLFPGGGGQGVEVEDSLLLAASPLLQRATPSHGTCSTAIVLPFVTSTTLRNFAAVLRQGRVTIAKEEITNLEALFSVLEIKIGISIGSVCETSIFTKGECELLKTKGVKPVEGARAHGRDNQPGCTTPSVSHPLKTFSLLHTVLASPAKRPAVTSPTEDYFTPKEEPMPKRRRICAGQVDSFTTSTSQLPSTKPPQQHDPVTLSPPPLPQTRPPVDQVHLTQYWHWPCAQPSCWASAPAPERNQES